MILPGAVFMDQNVFDFLVKFNRFSQFASCPMMFDTESDQNVARYCCLNTVIEQFWPHPNARRQYRTEYEVSLTVVIGKKHILVNNFLKSV
jgi:hypothetical protein